MSITIAIKIKETKIASAKNGDELWLVGKDSDGLWVGRVNNGSLLYLDSLLKMSQPDNWQWDLPALEAIESNIKKDSLRQASAAKALRRLTA